MVIMCRLALYLGPEIKLSSLVTEPSHSIIHQSFHSRERDEPLNGDGFGVAWYGGTDGRQPAVFKEISPAWSNANLLSLAPIVESECILAHVRAATVGLPVMQTNCHPFSWKDLTFMHNGEVAGYRQIQRELRNSLSDDAYQWVKGSTDSEHLFATMLDHYAQTPEIAADIDRLSTAMIGAIQDVELRRAEAGVAEDSYLNLVATNGNEAVVSRYSSSGVAPHSLYVNAGNAYVCEDGTCHMLKSDRQAVLVASEPLSGDDGWEPVPANHLVRIHGDRQVEYHPIVVK